MTDRISLTAAEIAFLLTANGGGASGGGGLAPRVLGLTAADRTESVIAAGLGSLVLRHLVAPASGQRVELAPVLVAVTEGLLYPRICVQVGLVADNLADGALLFESGRFRFLLAPRAYRCFDVTGVDPDVDPRMVLLPLARDFVERHGAGTASFNVLTADRRLGWASVAARPDGGWDFLAGRDPDGAAAGLTVDAALDRLHDELGDLLPGRPAFA